MFGNLMVAQIAGLYEYRHACFSVSANFSMHGRWYDGCFFYGQHSADSTTHTSGIVGRSEHYISRKKRGMERSGLFGRFFDGGCARMHHLEKWIES